jgi:hypothetical protein
MAMEYYPSDLILVHRDADGETVQKRVAEIASATTEAGAPPHVPVVPVRMQEAWLLFDEGAIRRAAGNPRGTVNLPLPPLHRLDSIADPKETLRSVMVAASELRGRHLERFQVKQAVHTLARTINDFAPLRRFPAFTAFEHTLSGVLKQNGW